MDTLGERIQWFIQDLGIKGPEIAKALGVSKQSISKGKNGDTKDIRMANLFAIQRKYGYSAEWIATGVGPRYLAEIRDAQAEYIIERKIANHELIDVSKLPPKARDFLAKTVESLDLALGKTV